MIAHTLRATGCAAAALLLSACSHIIGGGDPSFMRANVDGDVVYSYHGDATFHTGTPARGRQQFSISSYDGESRGPSFAITRWDGGRLPVGTYAIELVDIDVLDAAGQPRGITLQYFHRDETHEQQFVGMAGELHITHSTRSRVRGTFAVTAQRYCRRPNLRPASPHEYEPPEGPCNTLPATVLENTPVIAIHAEFAATPLRVGRVEIR